MWPIQTTEDSTVISNNASELNQLTQEVGAIGIEKTRDAKVYIEYILSFKTTTKNKLIYKSVHLFMCLNAY